MTGPNARLFVLTTESDTTADWIYAGRVLQQLMLTATHSNVPASFITQPFEERDRQREDRRNQLWPRPVRHRGPGTPNVSIANGVPGAEQGADGPDPWRRQAASSHRRNRQGPCQATLSTIGRHFESAS